MHQLPESSPPGIGSLCGCPPSGGSLPEASQPITASAAHKPRNAVPCFPLFSPDGNPLRTRPSTIDLH